MPIKSLIRTIPDYPKAGIMFRDITTLLKDSDGFCTTIAKMVRHYRDREIDLVAGIESRGFIIGAALAIRLGVGFVPIRKKGKLPGPTVGQDYQLEYGSEHIEMHVDAVGRGQKILLIDDLIASGGTAAAAVALIESIGARIVECGFVIELPELGGRERLERLGHNVHALCTFEGE